MKKMKKHFLSKIMLGLGAAALLSACNNIDENERYIPVDEVQAKRVVLLEEFTGQKCLNCSNAHTTIATLVSQYPDNFIPVSIHAGGNAFSYGEGQQNDVVGLRIREGERYASAYGILAFPAGVVNRRTEVQTMDQWAASIRSEVVREAQMGIKIQANLSADGKKIEIKSEIDPYANNEGYYQLWLVESGIVARQMMPDGSNNDQYVHNHVYRASINGHDGEAVSLKLGEKTNLSHSIDVKANWNPANMSVVGFVYNSNGVEQAAEAHVK